MARHPQVKLLEEQGWTPDTVTAYLIFRYRVTGDTLTVQWLDWRNEAASRRGRQDQGQDRKGPRREHPGHFTDTTENVAKFVAATGDDPFSQDVLKLERVK